MSEVLNVKVGELRRFENGKVKAFCDLVFGDLFLVRGFRIVHGEKGIFVGMPQQQSKQGKWFDVFRPVTNEVREYITQLVLEAYRAEA